MVAGRHKRAVGVFSHRRDVEAALRELRDSGYSMDRVSVITRDADRENIAGADVRDEHGRDAHGNVADRTKADEGATTGAVAGGTLGGLTGLLVGLGTLAIPGIGPIMLAGAAATALATTLAGGALGALAGSLIGGLIGLGIPEERAREYSDRVSRGHYLVLVEGTDDEIRRAEAILSHRGIEDWGVYDSPDAAAAVGRRHRAIGVFPHRREAETALEELRDAGFPMSQTYLVARDSDRYDRIPHLTVRDRFDNGFFGFPEDRYHFFHDRFNRGEYLVVVDGTADEIRRAEPILSRRGIQHWGIFDAPSHDPHRTDYATPGTPRSGAGRRYRAVGVFPHRRHAEAALHELRDAGFDMDRVSVVGKDLDNRGEIAGADVHNRATGNKADEGAKGGAATGAALGGLGGLLVGLGALAIPGIGPVIAGGTLATALATAAAGGAIGAAAGGLTGALVGLGIPEERARHYNDRVNRGDYLVMVDGTEDEIRRAEPILSRHGIQDWGIFDAADVAPGHGSDATHDRHDRDVDRARPGYAATATTPRASAGRHRRAVGVFRHRRDAEAALHELRSASFDMDRVSVVGKDLDNRGEIAGADVHNRATGNKVDEGAKGGAATGAALGGLGGLLVGLGALAIPGIGPVIAGGALATALATTAAGSAIGAAAGGLTGALVGLGIPEERARHYNDRVNHGDYLVMVDGTEDELHRAQPILSRHGIQDWGIYDTGDVTPERSHHDTRDVDRTTGTAYATPGSPRSRLVHNKRAVGVFPHRRDAELAVRELSDAGFPMSQVSLVGKDVGGEGHVAGGNVADRTKTDEGAKAGAAGGAALGGLGGLLLGLGALAIPGIGPVLAGGALATALATTAAGGAIGAAAGGVTGALVGLGIPDNRARHYNDRVNRGDYLVMVDGTEDEIRHAEPILRRRGIQDWDVFDAADSDRTGQATRHVIEPEATPGVTSTTHDPTVVSGAPEVIIIDHRDQRDRTV